jgi:hypothetical protein
MAASANEMDNRQMPSSIDLNKLRFIFVYVIADDTKAISMNNQIHLLYHLPEPAADTDFMANALVRASSK